MSMDPSKWIPFDKLSNSTKERIETVYPYLKLELCMFQDKESGVFMKAINNVKIEKLLDSEAMAAKLAAIAAEDPTVKASSTRSRK